MASPQGLFAPWSLCVFRVWLDYLCALRLTGAIPPQLLALCKQGPSSSVLHMTVWPSGLRRWLQAPVRKGVGSNPTAVSRKDARRLAERRPTTLICPRLLCLAPAQNRSRRGHPWTSGLASFSVPPFYSSLLLCLVWLCPWCWPCLAAQHLMSRPCVVSSGPHAVL